MEVKFLNWYTISTILGLVIPIKVYHVLLFFGLKKVYKMWRVSK
tara:strand:+ start:3603 stop:3734 length:132 start_codon:yes stop_codon:yes gene_type:complete